MAAPPRVVLIHATPIAMEPIEASFAEHWSDAGIVNILDDSLSPDRARESEISEQTMSRIGDLTAYAVKIGADGVLFTCSAFGSAIEEAAKRYSAPVLKPNEAMFEAALNKGARTAMIATFAPAKTGMEEEFRREADRLSPGAALTTHVVEPAMTALLAGDADRHNELIAAKASGLSGFDAIMLAHFSTSRAAAATRAVTSIPVLTSPEAAVAKLKKLIIGESGKSRCC